MGKLVAHGAQGCEKRWYRRPYGHRIRTSEVEHGLGRPKHEDVGIRPLLSDLRELYREGCAPDLIEHVFEASSHRARFRGSERREDQNEVERVSMGKEQIGRGATGETSIGVPTAANTDRLIHEGHSARSSDRRCEGDLWNCHRAEGDSLSPRDIVRNENCRLLRPRLCERAYDVFDPFRESVGAVHAGASESDVETWTTYRRQETCLEPSERTAWRASAVDVTVEPVMDFIASLSRARERIEVQSVAANQCAHERPGRCPDDDFCIVGVPSRRHLDGEQRSEVKRCSCDTAATEDESYRAHQREDRAETRDQRPETA